MKVAALYDIHGNLPALEAVLDEVRREGVDMVMVGGDVMPGPMPRECLDTLLQSGIPTEFIHGNGESAVLESLRGGTLETVQERFREGIRWSAQQLSADQRALIAQWPLTRRITIDGIGDVLFCHATPRNDTEILTKLSPPAHVAELFAGVKEPLAVCGHTHMQFDLHSGALRIVNAGSLGMPFAPPGAYWVLLGPDVQLRHTPYDLQIAATRIRLTSYPDAKSFANDSVLHTRPEDEVLGLFAAADGRT